MEQNKNHSTCTEHIGHYFYCCKFALPKKKCVRGKHSKQVFSVYKKVKNSKADTFLNKKEN